jgi:hypothetical protein
LIGGLYFKISFIYWGGAWRGAGGGWGGGGWGGVKGGDQAAAAAVVNGR